RRARAVRPAARRRLERPGDVMTAGARTALEQTAMGLVELDDRGFRDDAWLWATALVKTIDEATQRVRPWPVDKGYLHEFFDALEQERLIAVPKSRRMMGSWGACAWGVHRARYHANHAIFIQSETEDKASYLVDKRCAFIEDH